MFENLDQNRLNDVNILEFSRKITNRDMFQQNFVTEFNYVFLFVLDGVLLIESDDNNLNFGIELGTGIIIDNNKKFSCKSKSHCDYIYIKYYGYNNEPFFINPFDLQNIIKFKSLNTTFLKDYLNEITKNDFGVSSSERLIMGALFLIFGFMDNESTKEINYSQHTNSAINLIKKYYYDSELTVSQIAYLINVSSSHLCRVFRRDTGKTVKEFISYYRIEIACKLLIKTTDNVIHIATSVGYNDTNYFFKIFKAWIGVSPSLYRKKVNNL